MSEVAMVLPHIEVPAGSMSVGAVEATFACGDRGDARLFRQEIGIRMNADGSLVYAHAWGLPGGAFDDRSSCSMAPVAT